MGVDYSSSMLNIQDNHAYDIKNFLKRNGTLQKRPPIEQTELECLNGYWECHYKGNIVKIAHIKDKLVQIHSSQSIITDAVVYKEIETTEPLKNQKSWGIFTNDRLYILCGKYIVVKFTTNENGLVSLSCHDVFNDVDTYIPTTTIGITKEGSSSGINRTTLDNPNLMTNYRYNTINTLDHDGSEAIYLLDADVSPENILNINATLTYAEYNSGAITVNLTCIKDDEYGYVLIDSKGEQYGYIVGQGDKQGVVLYKENVIFYNPNPSVDNFIVKFQANQNESDLINNCTFGIMYGAGGNRNRLFVTGNPDKPNVDYHTSRRNIYASDSDIDLLDSQDLTYFSVYDYCGYGTSNTAITDYQIIGDGSLMVLKEESPNEPNVYFRDSNYETKTIILNELETQVIDETYPMRVGNIGEGAIRGFKGTLKNLNNDIVFVSDNGVFGISSTVSAGQLNSDYKYSYGRSRLINSKLKEDLLNALNVATCVYDHKYFLTIKKQNSKYITYVADGRYTYKLKDSIDNEYEYEWFVLDGIEADKYFVIENKLCFSNEKYTYSLDLFSNETTYQDKNIQWIGEGEIEYINGKFVKSDVLDLSNVINSERNHLLKFANNILIDLGEFQIDSNGIVDVSNSPQTKAHLIANKDTKINEHILYFSEYDQMLIQLDENKVQIVEDEENKFYIELGKNQTKIHFYKDLNFGDAIKTRFEFNDNGQITNLLDEFQYPCILVNNDDLSSNTIVLKIGGIVYYNNIQSYYLTKAYNFGQSVYNKYLKSMTIINDSDLLSYTNFGIITKEIRKRFEENYISGTKGLTDTYENIFKADLTTGKFSTSFTKDYLLKFNFIQFEFYNNDDTNCIINNFTILYTTGFKQKGVR